MPALSLGLCPSARGTGETAAHARAEIPGDQSDRLWLDSRGLLPPSTTCVSDKRNSLFHDALQKHQASQRVVLRNMVWALCTVAFGTCPLTARLVR